MKNNFNFFKQIVKKEKFHIKNYLFVKYQSKKVLSMMLKTYNFLYTNQFNFN